MFNRSDGKDFILDAGSRTKMMFWLQTLQNKRREYSLKRVKLSPDRIGQWASVVSIGLDKQNISA